MPEGASQHAPLIDQMLEFCHWFMLILFVGWGAFFLITLFKFHRSRNPKANYEGVKTKASTHIEVAVIIVEAVLLLGFALPLWGKRVGAFPTSGAVRVRVIGQQFVWNFHYPGPDGIFGKQNGDLISPDNQIGLDRSDPAAKDDFVTINDLHMPIGKPVILEVTSKDVIHSLSLQAMRSGQDCIPGSRIPMWFTPTKIGSYEIICGQLCGLGHYNMRATLTVDSEADYEAFMKDMAALSQQNASAVPATDPTGPKLVSVGASAAR